MTKSTSHVMKNVGTAIAIGGAVAVIGSAMSSSTMMSKRKMRRAATKAVKTVEDVISGVQSIIK